MLTLPLAARARKPLTPPVPRLPAANYHHDNLDLFWSAGFGICAQLPGFEDGYYGNSLWIGKDGGYGGGQACKGAADAVTIVGGNTVWSPTGAITECGMSLPQWQAAGNDVGTTGSPFPADVTVLALARSLLGLTE